MAQAITAPPAISPATGPNQTSQFTPRIVGWRRTNSPYERSKYARICSWSYPLASFSRTSAFMLRAMVAGESDTERPWQTGNATARRCRRCACRAQGRRAAGPWVLQSRLQARRSAKPPARQMRARGCWPAQRRRASPGTFLGSADERRDGAAGHRPHVLVHDPSTAVDEEGLGHAEDPVRDGTLAFRIDQRRIRAGALPQELLRPGLLVLIHDAEELDVGQAPRRGGERRVLLETRDTPRRPEVDDHRLAAKLLERDRGAPSHRDEREGGRGPANERGAHRVRVAAEVGDEDGEQRQHDGKAAGEHLGIDPQTTSWLGAGSDGGRHQRDPSMATGAAGTGGFAVTAIRRMEGTSATRPPSAMMAVAIQIQETIGLIRTRRPTEPESMLWMDRYRSSVRLLRTAGDPMGSRWFSYWLIRGYSAPRLRPFLLMSTRARTDSRCGSGTRSALTKVRV